MPSRVLVSLRVKASPVRAFEVFTQEIGLWWRHNAMFRITPRSPGILSFEPGVGGRLIETLPNGKVFEIGRITVWEPGVRLVFGWKHATFQQDHHTEVEVRFDLAGDEARISVEHRGWDSVPIEHVARHGFPDAVFNMRTGEWWRAQLVSIAARLS